MVRSRSIPFYGPVSSDGIAGEGAHGEQPEEFARLRPAKGSDRLDLGVCDADRGPPAVAVPQGPVCVPMRHYGCVRDRIGVRASPGSRDTRGRRQLLAVLASSDTGRIAAVRASARSGTCAGGSPGSRPQQDLPFLACVRPGMWSRHLIRLSNRWSPRVCGRPPLRSQQGPHRSVRAGRSEAIVEACQRRRSRGQSGHIDALHHRGSGHLRLGGRSSAEASAPRVDHL